MTTICEDCYHVSMSRLSDHEKALDLRRKGKSYSQIKETLGISKSTLSDWLRNYPLSKEQMYLLTGKSEQKIERYRETRLRIKNEKFSIVVENEKHKILPISLKEIFMAGLFLYWGEGTKGSNCTVSVSNTDYRVIDYFVHWLEVCFLVPRKKIKISLQLYSDMNINSAINFWKKTLHMSSKQFIKPYIKKSIQKTINQKNGYGHGTCQAYIYDVKIKTRIMAGFEVIYKELEEYKKKTYN